MARNHPVVGDMTLTVKCERERPSTLFACLVVLFTIFCALPANAVVITTYHYDNARTGWNQIESTLTPANVGRLQRLTTIALDAQVDAQPLFVPGVTIAGGRHNVLYVATENNTIYALDAATGAILLRTNFGPAVPLSAVPGQCYNNTAVQGINSTPVIDPATNTLYVMIDIYENKTPTNWLQALDLTTLRNKVPPAAVHAMATLSDGSGWKFKAVFSRQRAALVEANGNIYAGFASFCDFDFNYSRGWLLGWDAGSLAPLAAKRLNNRLIQAQSPNDFFLSSIWMSGSGPAVDSSGNLLFATGNSDPSGTTYNRIYNLSESIIKISPDLTKVLSFFTPSGPSPGVAFLDKNDKDFGSGGVLRLPVQPGRRNLVTAAGKAGVMYLLNGDQLGGYHNPDRALGAFPIGACWCAESYFTGWDGIGRIVSSGGVNIMIWRLQTSPSVTLVNESTSPALPNSVQDGGFFTSVSSNRTRNAVVWAVGRPVDRDPANVILYAFDPRAAARGNSAWLFSGVAGTWPIVGGNANIVPVVANGRVYVASYKELAIFGLPSAGAVASAAVPGPRPTLPDLPADGHEIFATIKSVAGTNVTVAIRTGKLLHVDAAKAIEAKHSVVLVVDEPVRVLGSYDRAGILMATSIARTKPSPEGWPADR
jgi:outer membrane protein assembly factor BamB